MKKVMLFCGLILNWCVAIAIGFSTLNPGDVVNGSRDMAAGLSREKELKDQLLTVPVYIKTWENQNSAKLCTGTLVGKKYILTAKHCLSDLRYTVYDDWVETPVRLGVSVEVVMYTSEALTLNSIINNGKVYKFVGPNRVFKELTPLSRASNFSPLYAVSPSNYETISVSRINFLRAGTDMVLLTLDRVPQIVSAGLINPLNDIHFDNYTNYSSLLEHTSRYEAAVKDGKFYSNDLEFMGFGFSSDPAIYAELTNQHRQKIFLNLRTSEPSLMLFLKYPSTSDSQCPLDCFGATFINQYSDDGDSGAALSYQTPGEYPRVVIGVVNGEAALKLRPGANINVQIIQGVTRVDAEKIEILRRRN